MKEEYLPWIIFLLILVSIQGTWIFLDARKRGEHYWLWGLFGLLNTPTHLLIYLLYTRSRKIKCPDCGRLIHKNNQHCPYCGGATRSCPQCGEEVQVGWGYCPFCSKHLK